MAFALVLVDVVMPEKDEIETVREILAIEPGAIIFTMSGKDEAGDYQEAARMLTAAMRSRASRNAYPALIPQ